MNLSLTPSLEQFVREQAASGDYNNASEVVREALRLFRRYEETRVAKMTRLRQAIKEGDASITDGNVIHLQTDEDLDRFFDDL